MRSFNVVISSLSLCAALRLRTAPIEQTDSWASSNDILGKTQKDRAEARLGQESARHQSDKLLDCVTEVQDAWTLFHTEGCSDASWRALDAAHANAGCRQRLQNGRNLAALEQEICISCGARCDIPCENGGQCVCADVATTPLSNRPAAGACECPVGWGGPTCSEPTCEKLRFCSGHGKCTEFDKCECEESFVGLSCQAQTTKAPTTTTTTTSPPTTTTEQPTTAAPTTTAEPALSYEECRELATPVILHANESPKELCTSGAWEPFNERLPKCAHHEIVDIDRAVGKLEVNKSYGDIHAAVLPMAQKCATESKL